MNKQYFILNNRENKNEGYTEVSEKYIKEYISGLPVGERAYFINLGYAVMETDEEGYKSFYKDYRRERYINEEAQKAGVMSLNVLDTDEMSGTDIVEDKTEPFEERVLRKLMIEKIPEAVSELTEEEKELIREMYFNGMSERDLANIYGISNIAVHKRKIKILKKLQKFFEN